MIYFSFSGFFNYQVMDHAVPLLNVLNPLSKIINKANNYTPGHDFIVKLYPM